MTRLYSIALHTIAFLVGFAAGWEAWDVAHPTCSDTRYSAHLRWNLDVECRR